MEAAVKRMLDRPVRRRPRRLRSSPADWRRPSRPPVPFAHARTCRSPQQTGLPAALGGTMIPKLRTDVIASPSRVATRPKRAIRACEPMHREPLDRIAAGRVAGLLARIGQAHPVRGERLQPVGAPRVQRTLPPGGWSVATFAATGPAVRSGLSRLSPETDDRTPRKASGFLGSLGRIEDPPLRIVRTGWKVLAPVRAPAASARSEAVLRRKQGSTSCTARHLAPPRITPR
jgi:hypothetical protein